MTFEHDRLLASYSLAKGLASEDVLVEAMTILMERRSHQYTKYTCIWNNDSQNRFFIAG